MKKFTKESDAFAFYKEQRKGLEKEKKAPKAPKPMRVRIPTNDRVVRLVVNDKTKTKGHKGKKKPAPPIVLGKLPK